MRLGGDPPSCSRLGGALTTTAASLATAATDLRAGSSVRALLETTVEGLDQAGAALQVHAQECAEISAALRKLADRATDLGLVLDGLRVVEPLGPVDSVTATRRLAALAPIQAQADRLAARLGRAQAALTRSMTSTSAALSAAAASARGAAAGY